MERDQASHLHYVPGKSVYRITGQLVNSNGDFCWVDYAGESFPPITDQEVAELLFFAHSERPLGSISLPSLGSRFLCYMHDDEWYMKLYSASWHDVAALLQPVCDPLDIDELKKGVGAYWIAGGKVESEERTFDIDAVENRRHPYREV